MCAAADAGASPSARGEAAGVLELRTLRLAPEVAVGERVAQAPELAGRTARLLRPAFYDNRPQAPHPWDATDFHRFIDAAFAEFIARGATRLLVDLRANPGGDNSFSDHLVAWFADHPFRFTRSFVIRVSDAAVAANRKRLEAQGGTADSASARLAAACAGKPAGSVV